MKKYYLSWDLGGTKCVAGLIEYQSEKNTYVCLKKTSVLLQDAQSLFDLTAQLESQLQLSMKTVDAICIGAAGQYNGHSLILENGYPYAMPFADVAKALQWPHYAIIHDYATVLCATFTQYLYSTHYVKRLNAADISIFERRVTFGIGTGLGGKDGLLLDNGSFWFGTNEIGFIGLPALLHVKHPAHTALLSYLEQEQPNQAIVFESILSGRGLQLLYRFFYPANPMLSPGEIGNLMEAGKIEELTEAFAWYLGLFIATLQVTFMPAGGIWMTGGVLLKNMGLTQRKSFKEGIHSLPAYLSLRQTYPLGILHHPDWPLIGAAFYANKRLQLPSEQNAHLALVNTAL